MRAGAICPVFLLFLSVSPITQADCGGGGPWVPPYVEEVAAVSIGWSHEGPQNLFGSAAEICSAQKPPPNDSVSLCSAANPQAPGEIHACITGRVASFMSCEGAFYNGWALPVGEFYRCPDPERIWLGPYRTPGGGIACRRTVYQPFVPPTYTVELVRLSTDSPKPGYLAESKPSPIGGIEKAKVRAVVTCNGEPAPGVLLRPGATVEARSGGHDHHDETRQKGSFQSPNGFLSDPQGYVDFFFVAPEVAGDHTLKVECAHVRCRPATGKIWVGIKDLVSLYDTHLYSLVGRSNSHPRNHHLTWEATGQAVWLAELYKARFPSDPTLRYNDASLERGGLFDLTNNWSRFPAGHERHRLGNILDVRANPAENPGSAIPELNFVEFQNLACKTGGKAGLHSRGLPNQHYHVEFTGCTPKNNVGSIEVNPDASVPNGLQNPPGPPPTEPPGPAPGGDCSPTPTPGTVPCA